MKIINDTNSETLYHFLFQDYYDLKDKDIISATTLLKPVQEIILTKKYFDEIEINASECLWRLLGSAVHSVLDKMYEGNNLNIKREERLFYKINDIIISGKYDLIMNNKLYDYKYTNVWTIILKSRVEDWIKQVSIYRWLYYKVNNELLNDNGIITVILRDWNKRDILINNYPQSPIFEISIILEDVEEIEKFIIDKIDKIKLAQILDDNGLFTNYPCSKEERWYNEKFQKYNRCKRFCPPYKFCQQIKNYDNGSLFKKEKI